MRGFPSLCKKADVDPHSETDAVRDYPSGAACRLETEQCPTGRLGEGGRGEGNKYCYIQKGRHHRDTEGRQARAHCKGTGRVWHK